LLYGCLASHFLLPLLPLLSLSLLFVVLRRSGISRHFGNVHRAMMTLFRVVTLEDW
jgi:hypothetical protein